MSGLKSKLFPLNIFDPTNDGACILLLISFIYKNFWTSTGACHKKGAFHKLIADIKWLSAKANVNENVRSISGTFWFKLAAHEQS